MSSLNKDPRPDNDRKIKVVFNQDGDKRHAVLIPERPFVASVAIVAVVGALLAYFLLA